MHVIVTGLRTLVTAFLEGDPLWPAVTVFLVFGLIAFFVAAARASRR
ncbi:hypothetical protein ATKI12_4704 [Kitasatospora sp. Ki12]|nr:hypothetical protein [Kitasatospora xanthocidica]GHF60271.1 hypothetical protein GCM10018790_42790 [Kitasatospora xanthocidica]